MPLYDSVACFWNISASSHFGVPQRFFSRIYCSEVFPPSIFSTFALSVGVRLRKFATVFSGTVLVILSFTVVHLSVLMTSFRV